MPDSSQETRMPTPAWDRDPEGEAFRESMKEGSFVAQFQALILRNLAIKKRDRRKSLTELLMPLYWIMILAIVRLTSNGNVLEPVEVPHGQGSLMDSARFLNCGTLHVAPQTYKVEQVMDEVLSIGEELSTDISVEYYKNETELLNHFYANKTLVKVAVIFEDNPLSNKSYTLRFNPMFSFLPSAGLWSRGEECRNVDDPSELQVTGCSPNNYFYSGFSALQTIIDMALTNLTTAANVKVPNVILENFPRGGFQTGGGTALRSIVPLYMVFAWAQFIIYMMMLVVEEKEKKLKESMKMMGLRDSVYWLSWFTIYAVYVLFLSLVCIILLPLANVFQKANIFLLFLVFILYGFSSIMFGFMLTPFFNKAKVAGVVGNLVQISFSLLFYLQVFLEDEVSPGVFWGLSLLSPCAFAFAIDKVILFDFSANGLTFDSIWDGKGLPFAGSLIMLTIDIFLYLFLAYYLDNVIPSEYGTKRKPWFIFQKSFWVKSRSKFYKLSPTEGVNNQTFSVELPDNPDVELVSDEMKQRTAVRIRNLEKIFSSRGKKPVKAVDDFSLDIYEGQITAILGHNGAGKTTLFNILTGMTAPSQGSATIFGLDISDINELTEIRKNTGICPQHDVVFLSLTAREHLRFFARIRGVPQDKIESEVEQTLKEVYLDEKADTKASDLSGGQKRKLSIAIALIGDPKLIFLDEPTAGVDAYSRRKLWTLLKNRKEGKVILLTTHFMDEADILADRKAIMSKGRLRCCGTSLFLKNKFGLGYHLTLIVEENSDEQAVRKILKKVIPEVQLARYYGKEMSFILPSDSSSQFPSLFKQLDQSIASTQEGIEGYGVSMTTLEEVFLVLNDESEEGELGSMNNVGQHMISEKSPSASPSHTSSLQENGMQDNYMAANKGYVIESVEVKREDWRAFLALLKIRCTNLIREPAAVIFLILFPLAFTIGSIALANSQSIKISTNEVIALNPSIYGKKFHGTLLHNATGHELSGLVSTLTAADMEVGPYSGNYSDLLNEDHNMGAYNVHSFPRMNSNIEDKAEVRVRFNDSYMHSIPILVNLLNNGIMSSILDTTDTISVFSNPLPITKDSIAFDASTFVSPMMIGFAFTIIPAGLTMDLVHDREIKARYMLRLNGVGFHIYFSSYLIMMIGLYMVSYIGLLIIVAAFGVKSLIIPQAFGALALLYFLYMPAAILFSAVMSYMFDKSETARQFYPNLVTTLGFITYTIVALVDMLVEGSDVNPAQILHIILTIIFPPYIPFGLMYYINKVYLECSIFNTCDNLSASDYMTTEIIVLFVVTVVSIPTWYLMLRVADSIKLGGSWQSALWMKSPRKTYNLDQLQENGVGVSEGEDDDVKQERENVAAALQDTSSTSPVLIYDLGKTYKKDTGKSNPCKRNKESEQFCAVKNVSFEVKQSQVFGLLGPNGAGKTTTLSIMTAEESASWGKVQICGENIQSSLSSVFEVMGYCPQHDALWQNITVAEHIAGYAEIRGIRRDQVKLLVDMYVKGLEIEEHKDKKSKDCSGGTKRKLSYILSMLGQPRVVLLDEPSTGMDPKSKRFLWNSILSSFQDERSAILTTHSMEEADALCSSIGILVRGSMRCIGPIQHLKNKYGRGYTLEVKVKPNRAPVSISNASSPSHVISAEKGNSIIKQVQQKVIETFPNATLDEQFEERLIYKVPQTDVMSLALIFEMLEKIKSDGLVDEYALSQTTLEQVFLQFARQQEEEDDKEENGDIVSHIS